MERTSPHSRSWETAGIVMFPRAYVECIPCRPGFVCISGDSEAIDLVIKDMNEILGD